MAGILLVVALFTLNLTVVGGDIYGFLLYVYVLSLYSSRILPTLNELLNLPLLLANLDIGIVVCFYNDMTSYATIWLQFVFSFIYLIIVLQYIKKIH